MFSVRNQVPRDDIYFFNCRVKGEFRAPGTTMLAGCENPKNHEMWEFLPRKYKNVNGKNNLVFWNKETNEWVPEGIKVEWLTMADTQRFLMMIQKKHYDTTDTEKDCVEHFIQSKMCDKCLVSEALCECSYKKFGSLDEISKMTDDYQDSEIYGSRRCKEDYC